MRPLSRAKISSHIACILQILIENLYLGLTNNLFCEFVHRYCGINKHPKIWTMHRVDCLCYSCRLLRHRSMHGPRFRLTGRHLITDVKWWAIEILFVNKKVSRRFITVAYRSPFSVRDIRCNSFLGLA